MDIYLSICKEKLCQRPYRKCRNASRSTCPQITEQHRENTTENDGNYV